MPPKPSFLPSSLRHRVFWPPFLLLLTSAIWSLVDAEGFLTVCSNIHHAILDRFAGIYAAGALFFLATCVVVYLSPLGGVRIGGPKAKPIMGFVPWFAITLCTTIAIGILFWGTAEPLYHLHQPPAFADAEPQSPEARRFALSTLYLHWSFTPYAMYALAALLFALMYYNRRQPFSLSAYLFPLLGERSHGTWASVLDAVCLFSLVAGMAGSLGVGMLTLSGGLERYLGLAHGPATYGLVGLGIVAAFIASSASGLMRGIRTLSLWNLAVFVGLLLFVGLTMPHTVLARQGWPAMQEYIGAFWPRHGMDGLAQRDWSQDWTIFYWTNWLAWTPVTALFLGRLGRGRSVRAFMRVNLIYPALFAIAWMSIFGSASLQLDGSTGELFSTMEEGGPQAALFGLFDALPLSGMAAGVFLAIAFLSYTTAADSNTSAMGALSSTGISPEHPEPSVRIKVLWGVVVGFVAWVMVSFAGMDGLRMASNLGGFPALLLEFAIAAAVWRLIFFPSKAKSDASRD